MRCIIFPLLPQNQQQYTRVPEKMKAIKILHSQLVAGEGRAGSLLEVKLKFILLLQPRPPLAPWVRLMHNPLVHKMKEV